MQLPVIPAGSHADATLNFERLRRNLGFTAVRFGIVELAWTAAGPALAELVVSHSLSAVPKFVFLSIDQELTANSWQSLTAPTSLFTAATFTIQSVLVKEEKKTCQITLNWMAVA